MPLMLGIIITLSGRLAWRTESLAQSLEMLEGEDKWQRETKCFYPDVPGQNTLHGSNHVERYQDWNTRQVKQKQEFGEPVLFDHNILNFFACQEISGAAGLFSEWPTCQEMGCGQMQTGDFAKRFYHLVRAPKRIDSVMVSIIRGSLAKVCHYRTLSKWHWLNLERGLNNIEKDQRLNYKWLKAD